MLRAAQRTMLPFAPPGLAQAAVNAVLVAANHMVGARQWLGLGLAQKQRRRKQFRCVMAEAGITVAVE